MLIRNCSLLLPLGNILAHPVVPEESTNYLINIHMGTKTRRQSRLIRGFPFYSVTLDVVVQFAMCKSNSLFKRRRVKGPYSQPHLCFCLHARIWLLYFIRSLAKRRKITVKLLKIIKHTFKNTAYSKTIRIRFTMLYQ